MREAPPVTPSEPSGRPGEAGGGAVNPGTDKAPLSVAVITQNEERNISACLQSVAFAAQIVVVDSHSGDATAEIARASGAEVFAEPWRGGFGAQKQFAIDQCRQPWILILDADERIPPETAGVIARVLAEPGPAGYSFPRKNYFQGRWIRHAGWWPDRLTRLFRRGQGRMSVAAVHEGLDVEGPVAALDVPIVHCTESDLSLILRKIDHYSTLGAREAYAAGRRATVGGALVRAALTFLQDYVFRLGMLDGPQGLTLAATDGINKFCKYAKLAEMTRRRGRPAGEP